MKTCTKCGETKPLDEYHRRKRAKDGRESRCKACKRAYKFEWYATNRDAILVRHDEYRAVNSDTILAQRVAYRSRPEVKAMRARYTAEYKADRPHVGWEWRYSKRARAYGFDPRVSSFTMGELIEAHGDRCVHCGGPFESLDHYPQPISRGGEHSLTNCRPSCMNCQRYSWREDFTPTRDEQG